MYIYSLNKYIRCSVFLFSERVTALYCSSRGFATWRELCKLTVRNLLTPVLFQVTSLYGNSIIIRIFFKKKKKPSTSSCRIFIKYMYHSLRLGDILIHVTLHSKFKKIIILINVHEHLGKHKPCHLPHRNQGIYRPVTLSMGCLISSFLH